MAIDIRWPIANVAVDMILWIQKWIPKCVPIQEMIIDIRFRIKKLIQNQCWMHMWLWISGFESRSGVQKYAPIPKMAIASTANGTSTYRWVGSECRLQAGLWAARMQRFAPPLRFVTVDFQSMMRKGVGNWDVYGHTLLLEWKSGIQNGDRVQMWPLIWYCESRNWFQNGYRSPKWSSTSDV